MKKILIFALIIIFGFILSGCITKTPIKEFKEKCIETSGNFVQPSTENAVCQCEDSNIYYKDVKNKVFAGCVKTTGLGCDEFYYWCVDENAIHMIQCDDYIGEIISCSCEEGNSFVREVPQTDSYIRDQLCEGGACHEFIYICDKNIVSLWRCGEEKGEIAYCTNCEDGDYKIYEDVQSINTLTDYFCTSPALDCRYGNNIIPKGDRVCIGDVRVSCSTTGVIVTELCENGCADSNCIQVCEPETCDSLNKECGTYNNGCQGTISCGDCTAPKTCQDGICKSEPCTPKTCQEINKECGKQSDACGDFIECGDCTTPKTCENGICTVSGCEGGCDDNDVCTKDICVNDECQHTPIAGCGVICRDYQEKKDNECSFSLKKFFSKDGISQFYEDYKTESIVGIIFLIIIIGLVIYLAIPKKKQPIEI